MSSICKFCQNHFIDKTKNNNRSNCSQDSCKKKQKQLYTQSRDQNKYKASLKRFKGKNPDYLKQWRKKNHEHYKELNRKSTIKRYHSDINTKLSVLVRNRLFSALKGHTKSNSTFSYIGCSIGELKLYIESKFSAGMTWENHTLRGWHVDHIVPLSSFDLTKEEEIKKACHYTNLQPLWAKDNWTKGSKNESL